MRPDPTGLGQRYRGRVHHRGILSKFSTVRPVVAATDASVTREAVGFGYLTADGRWGLCGRSVHPSDPDGPAVVLVNELRAVEMCLTHPGPPADLLLVDSATAVDYLMSWRAGHVDLQPAGYDLRARRRRVDPALVRLASLVARLGPALRVQHVAAHDGHLLNEAADSLAGLGRRRVDDSFPVVDRATGLVESFLMSWVREDDHHAA